MTSLTNNTYQGRVRVLFCDKIDSASAAMTSENWHQFCQHGHTHLNAVFCTSCDWSGIHCVSNMQKLNDQVLSHTSHYVIASNRDPRLIIIMMMVLMSVKDDWSNKVNSIYYNNNWGKIMMNLCVLRIFFIILFSYFCIFL